MVDPESRPLRGVDRKPGHAVHQLDGDPPGKSSDDGFSLPHGLGHGQTEPLAERFLQDDRGGALQGVDLHVGVRREEEDQDVRIVPGGLADLGQDLFSFGIVRSPSPGQDEANVMMLFNQPVGLDHPQRVLETVKAGYLEKKGFVPGNPQTIEDFLLLSGGKLPVFVAQRIDGGIDEKLGNGQPLREPGQRKNRPVVLHHILPQKIPYLPLGMRNIDVAAPDPPSPFGFLEDQGRRLGIVDNHVIGVQGQPLGILAVDLPIGFQHFRGKILLFALQGVVKRLGHGEEIFGSRYDLPAGLYANVLKEGNEASQDFGDAAPHPGRIDMQNSSSPDLLRQTPQKIDRAFRRHLPIRVEHTHFHAPRSRNSSQSRMIRSRMDSRLVI